MKKDNFLALFVIIAALAVSAAGLGSWALAQITASPPTGSSGGELPVK